jgi:hypothetical protein
MESTRPLQFREEPLPAKRLAQEFEQTQDPLSPRGKSNQRTMLHRAKNRDFQTEVVRVSPGLFRTFVDQEAALRYLA